MILARVISGDRSEDLDLAFERMGLPTSARDYLREKLPHLQVLLTGLGELEGRLLRRTSEELAAGGQEGPRFASGDPRRASDAALLSGRRDQFHRLLARIRQVPEIATLSTAIEPVLETHVLAPVKLGDRTFAFGQRTYLMGVINVTPDSFSDGGEFLDPKKAIAHGLLLEQAGADILDVGGESTRPGATEVPPQLQLTRVLPVIEGLRKQSDLPISVDTRSAAVAREAIAAGATLVNDVSGLRFDREMAGALAASNAGCCLMHMAGTPETMQRDPRYRDVVEEVVTHLAEAIKGAVAAGIQRSRIWVDPGIGFGKSAAHSLFLLRRLRDLRVLGLPIVVGTSRKSFLGAITGKKDPRARLAATLGSLAAIAVAGGADVLRVHDVAEAKDALAVAEAIGNASEAGDSLG